MMMRTLMMIVLTRHRKNQLNGVKRSLSHFEERGETRKSFPLAERRSASAAYGPSLCPSARSTSTAHAFHHSRLS